MSFGNAFPCNTCHLVFCTSPAQRTHMRDPWHVYNLKRRMASLPPVSADHYAENVATSLVLSKQESLDAASPSAVVRSPPDEERPEESDDFKDPIGEQAHDRSCLFCTRDSDSLETNLVHMSSEHGLYIPEIEQLSSPEAILGYLRTVITKHNECLYCGMVKQSAEGVRRHMLDKGHCMINLEREPELLEFWELSDSDKEDTEDEEAPKAASRDTDSATFRDLSQGEYTLPSGKVVASKSKAREARLFARRSNAAAKEFSSGITAEDQVDITDTTALASPADSFSRIQDRVKGRAVAVRDAVGLVGVSEQQMRSLIAVQRKTQRQQAIVRASASWAGEKGGIHQRHYKVKMNLRAG